MNPKCPWCVERMNAGKGVMDGKWYAYCGNQKCPKNKGYRTRNEALAAASKRFMPKRSVEEIYEFARIVAKQARKNADEYPNAVKFFSVQMFHRIADYMTGVTE